VHLFVELLTLLLEHDAVGVAVQLLVGQLGRVLGVYLAEGSLDGRPRVLEIDLVAMQTLCHSHRQRCGESSGEVWHGRSSRGILGWGEVKVKVKAHDLPFWAAVYVVFPDLQSSCAVVCCERRREGAGQANAGKCVGILEMSAVGGAARETAGSTGVRRVFAESGEKTVATKESQSRRFQGLVEGARGRASVGVPARMQPWRG
jgi:hypothetical protein